MLSVLICACALSALSAAQIVCQMIHSKLFFLPTQLPGAALHFKQSRSISNLFIHRVIDWFSLASGETTIKD